jgi:hypothetical protein
VRRDETASSFGAIRRALSLSLVPGALAFLVFFLYARAQAGYAATVWYPGAVFLLVLLFVGTSGPINAFRGLGTPARASVGCLAAFTAWTYASIAWSDVKGDAWDGANRTLLYLVVYSLFVALAWRGAPAALLIGGYSLAVAILGLVVFVSASRSAHPDSYFLLARFAAPTGYQNANCALFSLAFWPAVGLASRREVPWPARASLLACSGVLVELALLSQSRAWLVAMPLTLLLYLAVMPQRVRGLVFVVAAGAAVVVARGPLLHMYPALRSGHGISAALHSARLAVFVSACALFVVGALLAVADHALQTRASVTRRIHRLVSAALIAGTIVALLAAAVWVGNPAPRIHRAWNQFKGKPSAVGTSSYFTQGFGSNRYDIWRVAAHEISRHPLAGVGSDNFAVDYLRERRSDEEPLYPHSLELKIAAQTGVVGAVLFLAFLVSALIAWARRRPARGLSRSVGAIGVVAFGYWAVHGSVDWFWEIPALGAPAFAFLGIAASTSQPRAPREPQRGWLMSARIGVAIVAIAAAASLVAPWFAAEEVRAAAHGWRADPARSFRELNRARELNPLSDDPDLVAGAIASRLGETQRMQRSFRRALRRNPHNWYARLELAVAESRLGGRRQAFRQLAVAARLDPREPTISIVARLIRARRPVSTVALDRMFLERTKVSNRGRP